jgi:hypothetical protein
VLLTISVVSGTFSSIVGLDDDVRSLDTVVAGGAPQAVLPFLELVGGPAGALRRCLEELLRSIHSRVDPLPFEVHDANRNVLVGEELGDPGAHEAGAHDAGPLDPGRLTGGCTLAGGVGEIIDSDQVLALRRNGKRPEDLGFLRVCHLEGLSEAADCDVERGRQCRIVPFRAGRHSLACESQDEPASGRPFLNGSGDERAATSSRLLADLGELLGEGAGLLVEAVGFEHLIDQTQLQSALGVDLSAGEDQVECGAQPDQARSADGTAEARNDADLRLGESESRTRVVAGDAEVAGEYELQAASHTDAVDRRHRGHRQPLQPQENLLAAARHLRARGRALDRRQLVDVGAGNKVAMFAAPDEQSLDLPAVHRRLDRCQKLVEPEHHLARQQVDLGIGAVEGE